MIGPALAAVDAERIKLTSTRTPYWCLAMVVVFGVGVAVLLGWLLSGGYADRASVDTRTIDYLVGVNQFGVAIFAIMAVLGITTEYRFGTIRSSFAAVPPPAAGDHREDRGVRRAHLRGGRDRESGRGWAWVRRSPATASRSGGDRTPYDSSGARRFSRPCVR